jgi:hypothetical protein
VLAASQVDGLMGQTLLRLPASRKAIPRECQPARPEAISSALARNRSAAQIHQTFAFYLSG